MQPTTKLSLKIANYESVAKGIHTNIGDSGNKLSGGQNKGFRSLVLF
jgi:ABC-type transport system involved in cytochrome bd biosynthesis fused ATPase/permease subunit